MKIIYTHAVAAGGAALPVTSFPSTTDLEDVISDFFRDVIFPDLAESLRSMFAPFPSSSFFKLGEGGPISTDSGPMRPTLPIDLSSQEFIMPTQGITCHLCRSHSGTHKTWCRR